ncbi:MAG: BON domain-containing protein [Parachlamydiaceae bacterium]|nr:BON domain-containing protein [Parachlamydiaceae bacterium]
MRHMIILGTFAISSAAGAVDSYIEYNSAGYPVQKPLYNSGAAPINAPGSLPSRAPNENMRNTFYYQNRGEPGANYYYQDQSNTERRAMFDSDRDLLNRISDVMKGVDMRNRFRDVSVRVNDGVVTLSGWVNDVQDRVDLKTRIQGTVGVKNVLDQLQIRNSDTVRSQVSDAKDNATVKQWPSTLSNVSDDELLQKIRSNLRGGFFSKGYENVDVKVHAGNVTLTGVVNSESDRKAVLEKVSKMNGVKKVLDQINIRSTSTSKETKPN